MKSDTVLLLPSPQWLFSNVWIAESAFEPTLARSTLSALSSHCKAWQVLQLKFGPTAVSSAPHTRKQQTRWCCRSNFGHLNCRVVTCEYQPLTWGDHFCCLPSWLHHRSLWNKALLSECERNDLVASLTARLIISGHMVKLHCHTSLISLRLEHRSSIIQTQCHSASSTDFDQA